MKTILTPFMILAGVGLFLSLLVHLFALFGLNSPIGRPFLLHAGVFIVWIPAVLVSARSEGKSKDPDDEIFSDCPRWMKRMTVFFFGYAVINFIIFFILTQCTGIDEEANELRGFSGHWMAFYSAALAALYNAINKQENDNPRRCPNGHLVGPSAHFCDECGEKIIDPEENP